MVKEDAGELLGYKILGLSPHLELAQIDPRYSNEIGPRGHSRLHQVLLAQPIDHAAFPTGGSRGETRAEKIRGDPAEGLQQLDPALTARRPTQLQVVNLIHPHHGDSTLFSESGLQFL